MDYVSPSVVANGTDLLDSGAGADTPTLFCTIGVAAMLVAAAVAIWLAAVVEGVAGVSLVAGAALATAVYGVTHDC